MMDKGGVLALGCAGYGMLGAGWQRVGCGWGRVQECQRVPDTHAREGRASTTQNQLDAHGRGRCAWGNKGGMLGWGCVGEWVWGVGSGRVQECMYGGGAVAITSDSAYLLLDGSRGGLAGGHEGREPAQHDVRYHAQAVSWGVGKVGSVWRGGGQERGKGRESEPTEQDPRPTPMHPTREALHMPLHMPFHPVPFRPLMPTRPCAIESV